MKRFKAWVEEAIYFLLGFSFIVNLILIWSHFKFMQIVANTPVQEAQCEIESAFQEFKPGEVGQCKDYWIVRHEDRIVAVKK